MTTALVLLVLTGHAFVVSATHFHRAAALDASASARGAQLDRPAGTRDATPSAGHEQCLLCQLQRDLVSVLQHTIPGLVPPAAEAIGRGQAFDTSVRTALALAPPGRGPPSA